MLPSLTNTRDARPRFEFYPLNSPQLKSVEVEDFPFVIGRGETVSLQVNSTSVSREHVELTKTPTGFRLRDLNSTNGTCVNGQPITESPLVDGDSVSIADIDLTFVCTSMGRLQRTLTRPLASRKPVATPRGIPEEVAASRGMSEALLYQTTPMEWSHLVHRVTNNLQATAVRIVPPLETWMRNADSKDPAAIASRLETLAWQLAAERVDDRSPGGSLLLSVTQRETFDERLVDAIDMAVDWLGSPRNIGVAVHWEWATGSAEAERLCGKLRDSGFLLAFVDFSGGGGCVDSMVHAPPDYLLFSNMLIRGAASQPRRLQQLEIVQANCDAHNIDTVLPLATSRDDEMACGQIGINLVQRGTSAATPNELSAAALH